MSNIAVITFIATAAIFPVIFLAALEFDIDKKATTIVTWLNVLIRG